MKDKYEGHTPGPWEASGNVVYGPDDRPVSQSHWQELDEEPLGQDFLDSCIESKRPLWESSANAALIAAAPALLAQRDQLLAALSDMIDCLETEIECGDAFPYAAKIARARRALAACPPEED